MEPAPSLDYSCIIVGATVDVMQHFMNTSELNWVELDLNFRIKMSLFDQAYNWSETESPGVVP